MRNVYVVESGGEKLTVEFRVMHDDPAPGSERVVVNVTGPAEKAEQLLAMIAPRLEEAAREGVHHERETAGFTSGDVEWLRAWQRRWESTVEGKSFGHPDADRAGRLADRLESWLDRKLGGDG